MSPSVSPAPVPAASSDTRTPRRAAIAAGVLVTALLVVAVGRRVATAVPEAIAWVETLGVIAPLAFVALYAVATVAFVPGTVLTLAAGAVFGVWRGTAVVLVGATLGATLAFLLARYALRRRLEPRLAADPRFDAIDRAIATQGGRIVLLLRLSPVFPFSALNYLLGLTRVSLRDYVLASVGMLPGTLLYVSAGTLAGEVATVAGGAAAPAGPWRYLLGAAGLVATLLVTVQITRLARRALQQATDSSPVATS